MIRFPNKTMLVSTIRRLARDRRVVFDNSEWFPLAETGLSADQVTGILANTSDGQFAIDHEAGSRTRYSVTSEVEEVKILMAEDLSKEVTVTAVKSTDQNS